MMGEYGLAYQLNDRQKIFPTDNKSWDDSTDEQRAQWLAAAQAQDEADKAIAKEISTRMKQVNTLLDEVYGTRSNYKGKPLDWGSTLGTKIKKYLMNDTNNPYRHWHRNWYADMWKDCESARLHRIEKVQQEKAQAAREAKAAQDEQDTLIALTVIATRHGLDPELAKDPFELLQQLETKDHRLPLAIAMENARGDFSRIDRVYSALNNFTPVDDTDKAIEQDIQDCFDGDEYPMDGRIFRDTTWSYNKIFELVDSQLVEDVGVVNGVLNKRVYGW